MFTDIYNFPNLGGNNNSIPDTPLFLGTDGTFYSTAEEGTDAAGSLFSLVDGQSPFATLVLTSGTVGSQIGILGQGFSSPSVVKFNGVAARKVTLTGTTFLTATVPAGASSGFVTITTGATTLTSRYTFTVLNSWGSGKAIPTAVAGAASGFIGKIYVVSGITAQGGAPVSNTQIFNPATNTWTTGAAIPTPVFAAASAVVSGSLYVIGGYEGTSQTPSNLVQIYNPSKNTWTTGAAMPTARWKRCRSRGRQRDLRHRRQRLDSAAEHSGEVRSFHQHVDGGDSVAGWKVGARRGVVGIKHCCIGWLCDVR